ncbi:MAG TPA: T9SS type A sorting domain-containing protein [Cytophagaceae bacterium]|nr:T9SS type A sorting domain-containing protein [Cytophagaceae bacterium]
MIHQLHIYSVLFILLALIHTQRCLGSTNTVMVNNGDWVNPATWSMGSMPATGDVVDIPTDITVQITTNVYNMPSTQPVITIMVAGTMLFTSTGQLNIAAGSVIYVIGSGLIPSTGCNCNQLNIGGGPAEWKGKDASIGGGSCLPSPCTPLSAKILSFSGSSESGKVNLTWNTVQEENMDRYEVEKSTDALNFKSIGFVPAAGNNVNHYSFVDFSPESINYYRLKEIEKNNYVTYSTIVAVKNENIFSLSLGIYPNPAHTGDHINVHFAHTDVQKEVLLVLEDIMGKKYFSKVVTLETDSNFVIEDTESLKPGIYTVVASYNNKSYSGKVLVK